MSAPEIRTSHERSRGCGYRQAGGLYLVAGLPMEACELLPREATRCPVCDCGIKPARGWTWINAGIMFPPVEHGTKQHNQVCPFGLRNPDSPPVIDRAGLLWVGEAFYKTPREFMHEAVEQGISRRISAIPRDFKVGETWVLLGHRKAILKGYRCEDVDEAGEPIVYATLAEAGRNAQVVEGDLAEVWAPGIFTAFKPTAIEYIVKDDDSEEKLEGLVERGISLVRVIPIPDAETLPVEGDS